MAEYNIYDNLIIEYARSPLNKRPIAQSKGFCVQGQFPACSEKINLCLTYDDYMITDATWDGNGSAILFSSASITTDYIKNKSLIDVNVWADLVHDCFMGRKYSDYKTIGNMINLMSVRRYPRRLKSATVVIHALKLNIAQYMSSRNV